MIIRSRYIATRPIAEDACSRCTYNKRVWPTHDRARSNRVRDVRMHMAHSRCVIHGQKAPGCITCLSRYFPESVCTGLYGVGYSLSLYYLLLVSHTHSGTTYSAENITWTEKLTPITVKSFDATSAYPTICEGDFLSLFHTCAA